MKVPELIKLGFFSKTVAEKFNQGEGNQKKIFVSGSSSVSQLIVLKNKNPENTNIINTQELI